MKRKSKSAPTLDYKLLTTKTPDEATTTMMERLLAAREQVRALCKSAHMASLVDCLTMQKATAAVVWRPGNKDKATAMYRLLMVDEETYGLVLTALRELRAVREATPADFGAGDA